MKIRSIIILVMTPWIAVLGGCSDPLPVTVSLDQTGYVLTRTLVQRGDEGLEERLSISRFGKPINVEIPSWHGTMKWIGHAGMFFYITANRGILIFVSNFRSYNGPNIYAFNLSTQELTDACDNGLVRMTSIGEKASKLKTLEEIKALNPRPKLSYPMKTELTGATPVLPPDLIYFVSLK